MISISVNTSAGTARLVDAISIKAGGFVPVRVEFDASPGDDPYLELALSPDASPPIVVAYLDEWERQSEVLYTGWLDASDSRLLAQLSSATSRLMLCEFSWTVAGRERGCPNFSLQVQRPIVTGPESSEGGPSFYTKSEIDALLAGLAPKPPPYGELEGTEISLSAQAVYTKTISGSVAFTVTDPVSGTSVVLRLMTTGNYQPTWPEEITWAEGSAPEHPASSTVLYQFIAFDDGILGLVATGFNL